MSKAVASKPGSESLANSESLARELPQNQEPVHIYCKQLPCEVGNLCKLASLPGSKLKFDSVDTSNAKSLENTIAETLYLKPKSKVMLLYNINSI